MLKRILLSLTFLASSLLATADPGHAQTLFSEDFESGNFSKWSMIWQTDRWSIVSSPTSSSNKVARVYFNRSSSSHVDDNQMLIARPFNGIKRWFTRAYIYFPENLDWDGALNNTVARKLIYFKGSNWDSDGGVWGCMIGGYAKGNGQDLSFGFGNHGGTAASRYGLGYIAAGKWHCLELEIDISRSRGNHILRVWVNGVKTAELTNLDITGANSAGLHQAEIGRQIDFVNNSVSEYRYWDDIAIGTAYIGPKTGGTTPTSDPLPPATINPPKIKLIN